MKISVFGMGYVGCVTTACLIKQGHEVIGVDVIPHKIDILKKGNWPIYEPGLNELNNKNIMKKNFRCTSSEENALMKSDVAIICVGTPNLPSGEVNLNYIESVFYKISSFLIKNPKDLTLLIRSTIPPGSTKKLVKNNFDKIDIKVGFIPEFLREGNAINDFFSPSLKVVGFEDNFNIEILDKIFCDVEGKWLTTNYDIAESVKYLSNSWHALKIVFTNEISSIFKKYNMKTEDAMVLFLNDKKLNISPYYMKPGFAYGGSCLPKELDALSALAKKVDVKTPLLDSISLSNTQMIDRLELLIIDQNIFNVGFLGVSFKPGTDDIRNSPMVAIIKKLISNKRSYQKSLNIFAYDSKEAMDNFSNEFGNEIHFSVDADYLLEKSELIILGPYKVPNDVVLNALNKNKIIIDLKWHKLNNKVINHNNYHSLV